MVRLVYCMNINMQAIVSCDSMGRDALHIGMLWHSNCGSLRNCGSCNEITDY